MPSDVSKCNVVCPKSNTCGHAKSQAEQLYDFKHVCKNESMYFEDYENGYKDSVKVEDEVKEIPIEQI